MRRTALIAVLAISLAFWGLIVVIYRLTLGPPPVASGSVTDDATRLSPVP